MQSPTAVESVPAPSIRRVRRQSSRMWCVPVTDVDARLAVMQETVGSATRRERRKKRKKMEWVAVAALAIVVRAWWVWRRDVMMDVLLW